MWMPAQVSTAGQNALLRARRIRVAKQVAARAVEKLKPDACNIKSMRREQVAFGKQRRHDGLGASSTEMNSALNHLMATRNQVKTNTALGACENHLMKTMSTKLTDFHGLINEIRKEKDIIKQQQGAQCGELSRYVFYRLLKMGEIPCHICQADRVNLWDNVNNLDNHAFTVMGLTNPSRNADMQNWPDTVVICDPWIMLLAQDTRDAEVANPGAYSPAEYWRIVSPYFLNGRNVKVNYGVESL